MLKTNGFHESKSEVLDAGCGVVVSTSKHTPSEHKQASPRVMGLASMLALTAIAPVVGAESRATLDIAGCQLSSDGNKIDIESSCRLTSSVATSSEQKGESRGR